jgi:hypothetical protein
MSVSEFQRHEVFKWLEERMGPERAETMMSMLSPLGWSEIATRRDLEALEARLDARISERMSDLLLKLFFGMVASNATLVGLVFAAVRLG